MVTLMRSAMWLWAGVLVLGHTLLGSGCSSDDSANLAATCGPENQCNSCATCLEYCACKGGDPTTCSTQCGGGADAAPTGCSAAPDCGSCTACFDSCLCTTGNAQSCLSQCLVDAGGVGGFGGFGAGPATGGSGGGVGGVGAVGGGGTGAVGGGGCATPFKSGVAACDSCVDVSCCSLVGACQANGACTGLQSCLSQNCANTSNVQACFQTYCGQFGGGINAYNAMAQCILGNCNGPC
jgi:hypothetical protein